MPPAKTAPLDLLRRDLAFRPDLFQGGAAGWGLEESIHLARLGPVVALVDDDHGAERAGADAVDGFEAVLPILRRLAGCDLEAAANLVQDARRPPDVAGGAQADLDGMPALGCQAEGVVEGRHVVHLGVGDLQSLRDPGKRLARQVAEPAVDHLHHRDEGVGAAAVQFDGPVEKVVNLESGILLAHNSLVSAERSIESRYASRFSLSTSFMLLNSSAPVRHDSTHAGTSPRPSRAAH